MAISRKTLLFTLLLSSPILLFGEIRPSPLFSEHAVLAKREDVAIWGDAAPGERVEVAVAGAQAAVNANAQGNWRVTLNLADAPFGPHEMRIGAQVIPDVLIGETWLASGQSNVMLNLFQTEGAEEEIAKSTDNLFRFFWIDINPQDKKQPRLTGKWVVANPKTSPRITALGYYFVKALRRELQCPVGLLHASRGATSIISWMSEENIAQFPELVALEEQNQKSIIGYEERNPGKKVSSVIAFFGSRLYNGMIHILRSAKNKTAPLVRNSPNTQLEGFALCGKDNLWQWAERAEITGDGIMVSSPKVPEPVKVRYNWSSNPSGNLYNQAGFPAAPFQLSISAR